MDCERGHSIFEAMGKVQFVTKGEMQQKKARKRKRKTQQTGFVVQGFWIKERNKVKVNGVEREVSVVESLVTSPDKPLLENQCIVNDNWGFVTNKLSWTFLESK
jgi:hypothetical protein